MPPETSVANNIKRAYGAADDYGLSDRTPWLFDDKTDYKKFPEYLRAAAAHANKAGYKLGFTNVRYGDPVPAEAYADLLQKRPLTGLNDEVFPHFFSLAAPPGITPKHKISELYSDHSKLPVYAAYDEIYGQQPKQAAVPSPTTSAVTSLQDKSAALEVMRGGLGARALASTVGHLGAFPGGTIMSLRSHVNPTQWQGANGGYLTPEISPDDARAQKLTQLAKDMERADPEALKDHRVYLGGGDFFREIPRIFKNPRTSVAGKLLGLAQHPATQLYAALLRGSLFNPATNSTYLMGDKPAVLTHEIGHALDFNSNKVPEYSDNENKVKTWLKRQGKGLLHDVYGAGRMVPTVGMFHALYQEAQANRLSEKNLRRTYKDNPAKLNKILDDRQKMLPAGYGSYMGAAAAPFAGPFAAMLPLYGMLQGKRFGLMESRRRGGKYVNEPQKPAKSHSEKDKDTSPATIKMPDRDDKKNTSTKKPEQKDKKPLRKAAAITPREFGRHIRYELLTIG